MLTRVLTFIGTAKQESRTAGQWHALEMAATC
jgi:hypothetical protein